MDIFLRGIIVFFVILYIFSILYYKKQMMKKDIHIRELVESFASLQKQTKHEENRKAFRVMLDNQECTFELVNSDDPALEILRNRKGRGKIQDISFLGLKISCHLNLPIKKRILIKLNFTLLNEEFSINGFIVRKEETLSELIYGIQFSEIDGRKEQYRLIPILNRIELEKSRRSRDIENHRPIKNN